MTERNLLEISLDDDKLWETLAEFDEWSGAICLTALPDLCAGYFSDRVETFDDFLCRKQNLSSKSQGFYADAFELINFDKSSGYVFFTGGSFLDEGRSLSMSLVRDDYLKKDRRVVKHFDDSTLPVAGIYWETASRYLERRLACESVR